MIALHASGDKQITHAVCSSHVTDDVFPTRGRRMNVGSFVREYNRLYKENNLSRISLILEDDRYPVQSRRSLPLDEIVTKAIESSAPGEIKPVRLPLRFCVIAIYLFFKSFLLLLPFLAVAYLSFGMIHIINDVATVLAPNLAELIGVLFSIVAVFTTLALHNTGVLPLAAWRGRCSQNETVVFQRLRWLRFNQQNDLAIVRFVEKDIADVMIMSTNGTHAVCRLAGSYLWHFIACWAQKTPSVSHSLTDNLQRTD